MTGRRLQLALTTLLLGGLSSCTSGPPPPATSQSYEATILTLRAEKDRGFKAADNPYSPIPRENRAKFSGLPYFPVDASFRVPAALREDRSGPPVIMELPTSTGTTRRVEKVGSLNFTVQGTPYKLTAFGEEGNLNRLFVPFGDLTSNRETYGGGRYLDLDRTPTGLYDLDFNRAYHPSCVYNPSFECPLPPRENRLPIAIRAGERLAN